MFLPAIFILCSLAVTPQQYLDRADSLLTAGNYLEAADCASDGLAMSESMGDDTMVSDFNSLLGTIYLSVGDFEKASESFFKCYEFDKAAGNADDLAITLHNLASLYADYQRYTEAEDFIGESIRLGRKVGDDEELSNHLNKASEIAYALGDFDKALDLANEAFKKARKVKSELFMAIARLNRADALVALGRGSEAGSEIDKAIDFFLDYDDATFLANCYSQKADLCDSNAEAEQYYRKAIAILREYGDAPQLMGTLFKLADTISETDVEEAYTVLREANYLSEEIFTKEARRNMDAFMVRSKTSDAEKEFQIKEKKYDYQRRISNYLTILSILAILLIALLSLWHVIVDKYLKTLKSRNDLKDHLISIVSHDMRSPALAQQSALRLLVDNSMEFDSETYKTVLRDMLLQADKQVELIDNLLTWSRIQLDKGGELSVTKVNAIDAVAEVAQYCFPMAAKKEINCVTLVGGRPADRTDVVPAYTNRACLVMILRQLVINAIKFTPVKGKVTMNLERKAKSLTISVKDNGVGMTQEQVAHLFELRDSKSTPGTSQEVGSGLGLVVCKNLMDSCHGTIDAYSSPGGGTMYILDFPDLKLN